MNQQYPHYPGAADRETSIAAAESIAPKTNTLKDQCLQAFAAGPIGGLTADECAEIIGSSILSIRPRVTELARTGEIEDSGTRRKNLSGKQAIVWRRKWKESLFN
jgi:hypothetical protein